MKEYQDRFKLDYAHYSVPEHTRQSLEDYFFDGCQPGSFLYAVLTNDLYGACSRCDHVNREHIVDIVKWLFHKGPVGAWGNKQAIIDWIEDKGQRRTQFVEAWEKKEMWRVLNEQ